MENVILLHHDTSAYLPTLIILKKKKMFQHVVKTALTYLCLQIRNYVNSNQVSISKKVSKLPVLLVYRSVNLIQLTNFLFQLFHCTYFVIFEFLTFFNF